MKLLSIGLLVEKDSAVVWRGTMASNALKQLIEQADWGELDYFVIDMPPGTSDIHLTLVQTLGITGALVVTTPQEVALADARKGIAMFRDPKINVPVLGIIDNMAWFTPEKHPDERYYIFGREGGVKLAEKLGVKLLGQIPVVESICEGGDDGHPRGGGCLRPPQRHSPAHHQGIAALNPFAGRSAMRMTIIDVDGSIRAVHAHFSLFS